MQVAIAVNNPKFLLSHRLELCLALKEAYDTVTIITSDIEGIDELISYGFKVEKLNFLTKKTNIFYEFYLLFKILIILRKIKPDLLHCVTIRPIIYGGLVARLLGINATIYSIAGLGIVFSSKKMKFKILRLILKNLLKCVFSHKNTTVIFQNTSDSKFLIDRNIVEERCCFWIEGSGIDFSSLKSVVEPTYTPVVTFASRLLRDKGILDFLEAIKILNEEKVEAQYWIVGDVDPYNSNSISIHDLKSTNSYDNVDFFGFRKDVISLFQRSNIIVFPSYYGEGLPKVLIEAAAVGRAVVTTDHPGCREAVIDGETGILVPVKNPVLLANAIRRLIEDKQLRTLFGKNARKMALRRFDVKSVVQLHLKIYERLLMHDTTALKRKS